MKKLLQKIKKIFINAAFFVPYILFHKIIFQISNTKNDISFCVFRESFLADQYRIREFLNKIKDKKSLVFIDLGRNHGFVFYYALWHICRRKIPLQRIVYIGVEPAPLKFVYWPNRKLPPNLEVDYRLLDRAITFDSANTVRLKYGEGNFGNFNISGSNYENKIKNREFEYIEIEVETVSLERLLSIADEHADCDAAIVKIDCKYRTEQILLAFRDRLGGSTKPYLIACEVDGSGGAAVAPLRVKGERTLCLSNILPS